MAKVDLATIKNWFKTGLKPTQQQFWNVWDSFWHKDDEIKIENITGLENALGDKADANHSHGEYAMTNAENIDAEEWRQKLDLKAENDAEIALSQNYAETEMTTSHTQADMNAAVDAGLAAAKELIALKMSLPPDVVGDYIVRVSLNGEDYEVSYAAAPTNPAPENFQYTLTSSDIKSTTVEFDLPFEAASDRITLVYVRGLYVGAASYDIVAGKLIIDKSKVEYVINENDLVDVVYYKS